MSSGDRSPLIEDVAAQQERQEAAAAELNPEPNPEDVVDQAEREAPEGSPGSNEDVPSPRRLSLELSTRIKTAVYQLSVPLFVWKRGMGLETCTYPLHLNETPVTWPTAAHICSPFLVVFYTFVTLLSVGVQWLRCRHAYAIRYELGDNYFNTTTVEYSCQGSFLWMFLLPRLLGLGAYFILFVSWYWMRHLELMTLTYKIQDVIIQEDSYMEISTRFLQYLRQDRTVVVVTFLVVLSLSVIATLLGDGIVFNDSLQADQSGFTFSVIGEVFNFLVTTLINCAVTYCLVGHLLGLKYLELCLDKVSVHLDTIAAGSHVTSRRFTVEAYERLDDFIDKTQVTLLVGLVIALLHIGRSVSLVMKDLGLQPVRHESLGLLPISLFFLGCIIIYIHKGRKLTIKGYDCHSNCVTLGPDFVTGGDPAQQQQQQGQQQQGQAVVVDVENLPASPPPATSSPRNPSSDSPAQASPPNPPAGGSPAGGSPAGGSAAGGSPARGSGSGQSGAGGSPRRGSSAGGTPDRPASRRATPMPRYEGASILQRTEEEWEEALAIAPAVAPKLAFLEVSAWMYPALATITLLVTGVMYALQSTYPVV